VLLLVLFNMNNTLQILNEATNRQHLSTLVALDPHVDDHARNHILSIIDNPHPLENLFIGSTGALTALAISRFLQFKKETQILLSLAGFGAGVIISNSLLNNHGPSKST